MNLSLLNKLYSRRWVSLLYSLSSINKLRAFTPLTLIADAADPFIYKSTVIYEHISLNKRYGTIRVRHLDDARDYELLNIPNRNISFPRVFTIIGYTILTFECAASPGLNLRQLKTLSSGKLYLCDPPNVIFKLFSKLTNLSLIDPVLSHYDNDYFLNFTTSQTDTILHVYHYNSEKDNEFSLINSISTKDKTLRSAGYSLFLPFFDSASFLIQTSSMHYGDGVELVSLDISNDSKPISQYKLSFPYPLIGPHTLNIDSDYVVIDAAILQFSLVGLFLKFVHFANNSAYRRSTIELLLRIIRPIFNLSHRLQS
jgi:hypothetical protein